MACRTYEYMIFGMLHFVERNLKMKHIIRRTQYFHVESVSQSYSLDKKFPYCQPCVVKSFDIFLFKACLRSYKPDIIEQYTVL